MYVDEHVARDTSTSTVTLTSTSTATLTFHWYWLHFMGHARLVTNDELDDALEQGALESLDEAPERSGPQWT